ncbi:MAG: hypothetical protein AB7P03_29535 [Kofleriaceae bacterium]
MRCNCPELYLQLQRPLGERFGFEVEDDRRTSIARLVTDRRPCSRAAALPPFSTSYPAFVCEIAQPIMVFKRIAVGIALLVVQPACLYMHGATGAATPISGELDRGAQTRFAGTYGVGTGYLRDDKGGFMAGLAVDRIPAGNNKVGVGGLGLVSIPVLPWLHGVGRISYTQAIGASSTPCTSEICGKAVGIALGAHLVKNLSGQRRDEHRTIWDAPDTSGAGLLFAYQRVNLNGELGHYVGIELSVLLGGLVRPGH